MLFAFHCRRNMTRKKDQQSLRNLREMKNIRLFINHRKQSYTGKFSDQKVMQYQKVFNRSAVGKQPIRGENKQVA
jgi:hypothetical protein